MAVAGDVFGPAVAALTLGLTTRAALARRLDRNSAFDHAGNGTTFLALGAAALTALGVSAVATPETRPA